VITADEAVSLIKAGGAGSVVDVRSGAEFTGEHIPGSRLIPLDQIGNRADEVMSTPVPRLMLCRSGKRAAAAKESLEKLHVAGMSVIDGGILAYIEAGGETVKGKAVISLERQVRIAAGVLVLTGVLAGSVLHPGFLIISGFVGAGLIFAGITDWCGMGLLLAKMPWNRGSGASEETSPAHGTCSATLPGSCSAGAPPAGGGCSAAPPPADEESHDSSKK
jgi:rhodanese-related sulfurtransferase